MLEFKDFYLISEYASNNWRGFFSPIEIAIGAYEYFTEYQMSVVAKEPTWNIQALLDQLDEDGRNGSEEAREFATEIKNSIVTAARV